MDFNWLNNSFLCSVGKITAYRCFTILCQMCSFAIYFTFFAKVHRRTKPSDELVSRMWDFCAFKVPNVYMISFLKKNMPYEPLP